MSTLNFTDIENDYIRSKQDILDWIEGASNRYEEKALMDKSHSAAFYHVLQKLLKRFTEKIEKSILFEELESYWTYTISLSYAGASLGLQHICNIYDDARISCDQEYRLIDVNTRLLSVEEYAELYGVNEGTVRQWIRRGKIRSAVKSGRVWMIPELEEITQRGFQSGVYMWYSRLEGIPEEYEFLRSYSTVLINQNQEDKNLFDITYAAQGVKPKTVQMNTKEREQLELTLIQHPDIHSVGMPEDGLHVQIARKTDTGYLK